MLLLPGEGPEGVLEDQGPQGEPCPVAIAQNAQQGDQAGARRDLWWGGGRARRTQQQGAAKRGGRRRQLGEEGARLGQAELRFNVGKYHFNTMGQIRYL